MANGVDYFKETIKTYLDDFAERDEAFGLFYENPDKNIDECIDFIIGRVKASGRKGFTDDEIYGLAIHYYQEADLGDIKKANCKVVVNHAVELTEDEKEDARKAAQKRFEEEAYRRLQDNERKAAEREKRAKEALIAKAEAKRKELEAEGVLSLFGED